jgi:hypothetical protein
MIQSDHGIEIISLLFRLLESENESIITVLLSALESLRNAFLNSSQDLGNGALCCAVLTSSSSSCSFRTCSSITHPRISCIRVRKKKNDLLVMVQDTLWMDSDHHRVDALPCM